MKRCRQIVLWVLKQVVARIRQFVKMLQLTWLQLMICEKFEGLELIIIESGGDNLAATFSPELSDLTLYVIDVAGGEKIPRKGGPGITKSDLLIINKTDLAPMVGANLDVMDQDAKRMRGEKPFYFQI